MEINFSLAQSAGGGAAEYTPTEDPPHDEYPRYDTKSDGKASVMWKLWGMQSTSLLPSLPSQLCPGVVVLDKVLSMVK